MRRRSKFTAALFAVAASACTGFIGDLENSPSDPNSPDEEEDIDTFQYTPPVFDGTCVRSMTPTRVVKLTIAQIDNTTAAYLGTTRSYAAMGFPKAAEQVAADRASAEVSQLDCTPQAAPALSPADSCITTYIATRGKHLFRRPLTAGEVSDFYANYLTGFATSATYAEAKVSGIRLLLAMILQSQSFLYRSELGDGGTNGVTTLTGYELAAAIAYTVTDFPPDATLMARADSADLSAATVEAEVRRLLATNAGRANLTRFVTEWLGTSAVLTKTGDVLTTTVARDMYSETWLTIDDVLFNGSGTLADLLTVPYTFVNKGLADFYGYTGPTGSAFEKVSLTGLGRPGILAQGSFLAGNAFVSDTASAVTLMHRGRVLRNSLFCELLPTFDMVGLPADFERPLFDPSIGQDRTSRDQILAQSGDLSGPGTPCYSCHQFFVPVGTGFESFDNFGRSRTTDNGLPVDPSGRIVDAGTIDPVSGQIFGPWVGVSETAFADYPALAQLLASNARVHGCAAKKLFAFASARKDIYENDCEVRAFQTAFVQNGGDIVEAFISFVASPTFAERAVE